MSFKFKTVDKLKDLITEFIIRISWSGVVFHHLQHYHNNWTQIQCTSALIPHEILHFDESWRSSPPPPLWNKVPRIWVLKNKPYQWSRLNNMTILTDNVNQITWWCWTDDLYAIYRRFIYDFAMPGPLEIGWFGDISHISVKSSISPTKWSRDKSI